MFFHPYLEEWFSVRKYSLDIKKGNMSTVMLYDGWISGDYYLTVSTQTIHVDNENYFNKRVVIRCLEPLSRKITTNYLGVDSSFHARPLMIKKNFSNWPQFETEHFFKFILQPLSNGLILSEGHKYIIFRKTSFSKATSTCLQISARTGITPFIISNIGINQFSRSP